MDRKPEKLRLPERRRELRLRKEAVEITQRPRGRRDGDAMSSHDVPGSQSARAMDHHAAAAAATRLTRDRDVHVSVNRGRGRRAVTPQHAPELTRTGVTQHGPWAAGEHGSHPSPRLTQASVADSEDPVVNAVKAAGAHSSQTATLVNAGRLELRNGDDAVLTPGQASNHGVRIPLGALPTHVGG